MHRFVLIAGALLVMAVLMVLGIGHVIFGHEEKVHLTLNCSGERATLSINGKEILTHNMEGHVPVGSRLGLYMFKPFESSDRKSYFQTISIQQKGGPPYVRSLLSEKDFTEGFERCCGWVVVSGKGLTLEGKPGTRGVCLLKNLELDEFVLETTISSPIDAGIFFGASDEANGQVLIIRPFFNDVFFTFLEQGEPGRILDIGPLRELTAIDEALRLGGLVGSLLIRSLVFIVIIWLAGKTFLAVFRVRKSRMTKVFSSMMGSRFLVWLLFAVTLVALGAVARYSLDAVPHIADEAAYLFQAKIFAGGKLWASVPDLQEFFAAEHVIMEDGRWFAKYPPLFPLLLSLGVLAGFPWMVNPLIGAVSAWLVFLITRQVTGSRGWGLFAWLLLITSPFFLFINASMMAHATALLLTLLFIYLVCRGLSSNSLFFGLLAGLCMGALTLTRPFTALLVFLPIAFYAIVNRLNRREFVGGLKFFCAIAAGILPFLGLGIIRHCLYLPDAGLFATSFYEAYHPADVLGFGPEKGAGWMLTWGSWGHSPAKGFRSVYNYLSYSSQFLFGWPLRLSFALIGLPLFFGHRKTICWVLFAIFISLVVGHIFYWCSQHIGYGARYWYSGIVGLTILTVCGFMWLKDKLAEGIPNKAEAQSGAALFVGLVFLALATWNLSVYLPDKLREGHRYANVSADLKKKVEEMDLKNSMIFVKTEDLLYNDGFFLNDPFMNSGIIFARDLGVKNQELMERYSEYEVYYWDKKSLTRICGNGYQSRAHFR